MLYNLISNPIFSLIRLSQSNNFSICITHTTSYDTLLILAA